MTSAIPVLSLDRARGPDGAFDPGFTRALAGALHSPGFVQLTTTTVRTRRASARTRTGAS